MNDQNPDATPAIDLDGQAPAPKVWTVEDVLATARRVERVAHVCLRADLQAEFDAKHRELASLVTPQGELLDDEAPLNASPRARAQQLSAELDQIRGDMAANMWHVRFRGMDSDTFAVFNKQHRPKDENQDGTDYNLRLVAECAIEPTITLEQARELNKTLGTEQMTHLVETAWDACKEGGIDVPKLSGFLKNLVQNPS